MTRAPKAAAGVKIGGQAAMDPIGLYDPQDWYWIVGGDEARLWSSADRAYVLPGDAGYLDFLDRGALPSRIKDEAELWEVLRAQASGGLPDDQRPTRYVRKLLILDRLVASEQFGTAMAALGGPGQLSYERWQAAVDIAADDPQVRALLAGIGADPDVILAPE